MKTLITRLHMVGKDKNVPVGIQVGWRVLDRDGKPFERFWGSCVNNTALKSLVADLRSRGEQFEFPEEHLFA